MSRRMFLAAVAAAPLMAAPGWEKHGFPDWDADDVDRLLTDSPWAHPVTVHMGSPPPRTAFRNGFQIGLPGGLGIPGIGGRRSRGPSTGGLGSRAEVFLTVRWSSALPVRLATALDRWGRERLGDRAAKEFLAQAPADYVIEVFGIPAILVQDRAAEWEAAFARSARLLSKDHPARKPSAVFMPEQGEHMSAEFRFPRTLPFTEEDGTVDFVAETPQVRIETRFKLKSMTFQGELAL